MIKVSLFITTFNWPQALSVVLGSALRQSYRNVEIIIADDGSKPETANAVRDTLATSSLSWMHVRHDDNGIRQARVKNLAVRYATGDYFIFIDHDVALHPDFIGDHIQHRKQHCFLQGKRVFLSPELTERYIRTGTFQPPSPWSRGLENRKNAFRSPKLAAFVNPCKKFQTSLRGCNLSMPRELFMEIDGYDETFDGLWGREDSDICYRLFNKGRRVKNLWLCALQYHLHHPSIKRRDRDRLDEELVRCLKEKRTTAIKGYGSLSSEGDIIASGGKK